MAQTEEMKQTSTGEHRTSNVELQTGAPQFGVRRSAFDVRRLLLGRLLQRVLDVLIAAVFIYAGLLKILDPVGFARDIDNYKLVPWPVAVAFGFFLPWLETFSGLALLARRLYGGALWILTSLTVVFIVASIIAKARGLDITCGCFGHASKGWSFGWHMVLDVALLGVLAVLLFADSKRDAARVERN